MLGSEAKVAQAVRSTFTVHRSPLCGAAAESSTRNPDVYLPPISVHRSPEAGASSLMDNDLGISTRQLRLRQHAQMLYSCRKCNRMQSHPVSGGPVLSRVML